MYSPDTFTYDTLNENLFLSVGVICYLPFPLFDRAHMKRKIHVIGYSRIPGINVFESAVVV